MRRIGLLLVIGGALVPVALGATAAFPPFLRMWGGEGSAPGFFRSPDEIAVDARGHVYVADRQNNRVQKFDYQGHLLSVIGRAGTAPGEFMGPRGVAVDGLGALYVADSANNRIQKFDARGHLVAVWGRNGGDGSPAGVRQLIGGRGGFEGGIARVFGVRASLGSVSPSITLWQLRAGSV